MQTPQQIVSGTDFSPCAEQALALAIRLALAVPARLTLVHVCEPGLHDAEDRTLQCTEALDALVARLSQRHPVAIAGVVRAGDPCQKLDNVAVEVGASIIVIGRHGAGRGPRVAIGTVAEQLVRRASRSVLTVACSHEHEADGANVQQTSSVGQQS